MGSINQLKQFKQQKLEFDRLVHLLTNILCVGSCAAYLSHSKSNCLFFVIYRTDDFVSIIWYPAMIQERASLPIISLQPVVAGAAKKTSRAVGQATKTIMNIISRGEFNSENEDASAIDRVEI